MNVISLGICNAPAYFKRLKERVLRTLVSNNMLVFFDDVLIFSIYVYVLSETFKQIPIFLMNLNF